MGIQVPPDSTGKVVETNSPDGATQRQVVTVGDKTTAARVLTISAGGAALVDASATTQPVSAPALTKGTQGANGFSAQDLKDAGRTYISLHAEALTGVTTEALASFTKNVNGTETTAQTAYTITNGKTFVIQALNFQVKNTTTTNNNLIVHVRVGGSVSATSPIILSGFAAAFSATATSAGIGSVVVPDGIFIPGDGTIQIGISHLENITTAAITYIQLNGYEY